MENLEIQPTENIEETTLAVTTDERTVAQSLADTATTILVGIALATVISYGTQFTRKVIDGQAAKIQQKIQDRKNNKDVVIIDQQ